ncbi:MAG: RND family transporter, partial [Fulvivirga sp.]
MSPILNDVKEGSKRFGAAWGEFVLKYRWPVLGVAIALVMGLATGASNIGFDADYRVFFKKDNPQRVAYEALQKKYTQDDNVLIVIEPKDNKVFTPSTLSAIEDLTAKAWQAPFSTRVDAVSNFQHTYAEGDELYVEDLVEDAEIKDDTDIA